MPGAAHASVLATLARRAMLAVLAGLPAVAAAQPAPASTPAAQSAPASTPAPAAPQPAPASTPAPPAARAEPWTLARAAGLPRWLRLELEHQARYEHLANDFRSGADGDARGASMRTLVRVEVWRRAARLGLELQDARAYVADATPVNPTLSNPIELLQLHVGWKAAGLLRPGDGLDARAGRITIDLGTRRLVARNRFRNTLNGFTGVDATWTSAGKHVARALAAVPVTRLPADADALRANEVELDEENLDAVVWAAAYGSPARLAGGQLELQVVGYHERDGDVASRDRQLVTLVARWVRKPAPGALDVDLELMPQAGTSRATTAATDTADLDHRALSWHAEVGLSAPMPWRPRFALQHDYASGDGDPADGRMGRFDPLFAARRFDFGPTGLYGPFARSNLQSPGLRVSVVPGARLDAVAAYRLVWLASARDAWTTAGLRDPDGDSGTFLGQHGELQVRWSPLGKTLAVEAGAAHLRRGQFARSAPGARREAATYGYLQLNVSL